MEIDEVLEEIGGFGRFQAKVVFLLNLGHIACGLVAMCITFVGAPPEWSCEERSDIVDDDQCERLEEGTCTPKYSQEFTSIVSEVSLGFHSCAS